MKSQLRLVSPSRWHLGVAGAAWSVGPSGTRRDGNGSGAYKVISGELKRLGRGIRPLMRGAHKAGGLGWAGCGP